MNKQTKNRNSERGGASVKLLAVLLGLALAGNAGINYIPVAYEGQSFKQEMETAVLHGMATPVGMTPVDMVKGKLQKAIASNNLPPDTFLQVKPASNGVTARVAYAKKVAILPFGIYNYNYVFDHTATPTGFLLKD